MREFFGGLLLAGILALFPVQAHASLITSATSDAGTLVNSLLGSGVSISGASYTGVTGQSATFTGGIGADLSFDSGILLTSGFASNAIGPNSSDSTSEGHSTAGDADLTALAGTDTFDAAVLEFDFISDGGDLFFEFQFGSEEYNEFVDAGFNDVFGFFLDGVNVALVPGTGDVVGIDTINNDTNSSLFNDNELSGSTSPFNIEYDGFTDSILVSVTGLSSGSHHMKFAIADAGDTAYDSGVFIRAQSFSDSQVPEPTTAFIWTGFGLALATRSRRKRS